MLLFLVCQGERGPVGPAAVGPRGVPGIPGERGEPVSVAQSLLLFSWNLIAEHRDITGIFI